MNDNTARMDRRGFLGMAGGVGMMAASSGMSSLLTSHVAHSMPVPKGQAYSHNIDVLGYHDLAGRPGFQMAMQEVDGRYFLYFGSFFHQGWTILEVTDPRNPTNHRWIEPPHGAASGTVMPKVQVAGGIMVTAMQRGLPDLHGVTADEPYFSGIYVWDVSDPLNPKWLSEFKTEGAHRFAYHGGRYIHLSAGARGFTGQIYRIIDIQDPTKPVEVGRFWLPEQYEAGGGQNNPLSPALSGTRIGLHGPAYPKGNLAYLSYSGAGLVIVDISDITLPKLVGRLDTSPPFGYKTPSLHSVLPLSKKDLVVISSEGDRPAHQTREKHEGQVPPMNFMGIVDVSNPRQPALISMFPTPAPPKGWPTSNFAELPGIGPFGFGPHNLHEPHDHPALEDRNDRIYEAYFNAGLRIYDISDPYLPKEIAYFIPPPPAKFLAPRVQWTGPKIATAEDVLVDRRGNIFMTMGNDGLYVLRCKV